MHKSSSLTFFYKYLFTPIWAGFILFGIASIESHVDQFFQDWNLFAYMIVFYGLVWLIPMMIRLRKVEVNEDNIIIKSPMGDELITFSDVVYVSQYVLINPIFISLKYRRTRTGDTRKILIMPSTTSQTFNFDVMAEHEMTKFIRGQVIKTNPNYRISDEPSRWLTFILTMLGGSIIMIIGVSYFFANT